MVQNYFDKGAQTSTSMSTTNSDLIAVSLAYPKDPKSPYRMGPPSQQCPKAHGESWKLERYCNSGPIKLAFLTFTDLH